MKKNSVQIFLQKHDKIIGSIAAVLGAIMFFSLIEIMISNIQGKSAIFIQPMATAVNGFFWSAYGYGRKDYFIMVPNILGLIIGILTAISAFSFF
jgi:hypothetical protein